MADTPTTNHRQLPSGSDGAKPAPKAPRSSRAARWAMLAAGVVLLGALVLMVVGSRPPPERTFKGQVKDLLPKPEEIPEWTVEYLPIADTPEMKKAVSEMLNYDDAVFATYTRGQERVSVYIAYWTPGKMPHRLVAGHTPDVCWTLSGWKTLEARSGVRLPDGRGGRLLPVEERSMSRDGKVEHVAFWHLLDGYPMSYGTGGLPPWHATFTDLFSKRLNQRPEQFFIRLSGNAPLERWPTAEVYRRLCAKLKMLQAAH